MPRGPDWLKSRIDEIKAELERRPNDTAFRDQEFARAYEESGLSQEQIAKVHGCSRELVSKRLRFAAFLGWLGTSSTTIPQKRMKTLTEGTFRRYWEWAPEKNDHGHNDGEHGRFERVVEALIHPWRDADVAENIVASVRKGSWFTAEEMAEKHGVPLPTVKRTLKLMKSHRVGDGKGGGVLLDDRPYKATRQYRVRERYPKHARVSNDDYAMLVSDLESHLEETLEIVKGRTWASTSPELILSKLNKLKKRLKEARQLLKENRPGSATGDGRPPQTGFSVS